jgi:hypothetical protein
MEEIIRASIFRRSVREVGYYERCGNWSEKDIVNPEQAKVLAELEKLVGKSIPSITKIGWNTVGVQFEGDTIIGLGLYGCGLTTLPESFGNLKSLKELYLASNQLTTLPESFTQLSNLQWLDIYENPLDAKGKKILDQLKKNAKGVKIWD